MNVIRPQVAMLYCRVRWPFPVWRGGCIALSLHLLVEVAQGHPHSLTVDSEQSRRKQLFSKALVSFRPAVTFAFLGGHDS